MAKVNVFLIFILLSLVVGSAYIIKMEAQRKKDSSSAFPYFLSTKDEETNIRSGPSLDYPIVWRYNTVGVPLKIIDKFDNWYQIENPYGQKGWLRTNLVSNKKTAIIMKNNVSVRITPQQTARVIAILNANNIVYIKNCQSILFCKVIIYYPNKNQTLEGWVDISSMWGATD